MWARRSAASKITGVARTRPGGPLTARWCWGWSGQDNYLAGPAAANVAHSDPRSRASPHGAAAVCGLGLHYVRRRKCARDVEGSTEPAEYSDQAQAWPGRLRRLLPSTPAGLASSAPFRRDAACSVPRGCGTADAGLSNPLRRLVVSLDDLYVKRSWNGGGLLALDVGEQGAVDDVGESSFE